MSAIMAGTCVAPAAASDSQNQPGVPKVRRFASNPIIGPGMFASEQEGENINGPSLIRVPGWVPNPLGRYYLYFGHHRGQYIRLAYADKLEGPWKMHEPGALRLKDVPNCTDHIASPDVIIDEPAREMRMYFHGSSVKKDPRQLAGQWPPQLTYVATSRDGLRFTPRPEPLAAFYLRVLRFDGGWYGMAKGGQLYRSRDGFTAFEKGPNPFPIQEDPVGTYNKACPRHVALRLDGDTLWIYFSSIGDAPEHIRRCRLELRGDWRTWRVSGSQPVLAPQMAYEGADLPISASRASAAKMRVHELRDPAIFVEDKKVYLLYSVAGEKGIAIAEITE